MEVRKNNPRLEQNTEINLCPSIFFTMDCSLRGCIRKIGMIQRRLAWPLHKDDTLFQSGRPTGLNIYFSFILICSFYSQACAFHRGFEPVIRFCVKFGLVGPEIILARRQFSKFHSTVMHCSQITSVRAITFWTVPLFHDSEATTLVCLTLVVGISIFVKFDS